MKPAVVCQLQSKFGMLTFACFTYNVLHSIIPALANQIHSDVHSCAHVLHYFFFNVLPY